VLEFQAPTEPGDYPFVCTFPGHHLLMRGVVKVAP
jgi:azurin